MTTSEVTVHSPLDPTLAALLDAHNVPHSVDGVLAAFEERGYGAKTMFAAADFSYVCMWRRLRPRGSLSHSYGRTETTALARAFAALVESDEQ